MDLENCKHIRIRNGNEKIDVEKLVKSVEYEFKKDFTTMRDWKELLFNIENNIQDYELKIKNAIGRKTFIIDKLHMQNTRKSPFLLTDNLERTAHIWEAMKLTNKTREELPKEPSDSNYIEIQDSNYVSGEISDVKLTAHPNSEIVVSENLVQSAIQCSPAEIDTNASLIHLPVSICTNQHKFLSPLESQFSYLQIKQKESDELKSVLESQNKYGNVTDQTHWIICNPSTIEVNTTNLEKQEAIFCLTNSSTEATYIRFKTISDPLPFKETSIHPQTPVKLYPGLSKLYKFVFKLMADVENVNLYLIFRFGRNALSISPGEYFGIPVCLKAPSLLRKISVSKSVNIPPVYNWQINVNSNFPTGTLKISVDDHSYNLCIKKRTVNFIQDLEERDISVDVTGVNTESLMQKIDEENFELENKSLIQAKKEEVDDAEIGAGSLNVMNSTIFLSLIIEEIVDLALDTFVFQKTFLYLHPNCTYKIPVLFSKAEHEGCHQCHYALEFYDYHTEALVTTKITKVYAEVAPHPVQIRPIVLDMTESPITHGFREDRFTVSNNHKFYPVTLKIKMTQEMKRLFRIYPMEMTVPSESSAPFLVRVCSKRIPDEDILEDFVHFTIKIIMSGHESVYRNVPPFYYELILPCATEYYKVFGQV